MHCFSPSLNKYITTMDNEVRVLHVRHEPIFDMLEHKTLSICRMSVETLQHKSMDEITPESRSTCANHSVERLWGRETC